MRYLNLLLILLLYSCSGSGDSYNSGVVYYIDPSSSVNGEGTPISPFNTFAGIRLEPGAEYLIKRDTVLEEEIIVNASGKPGAPVIIGAYGTGADPVIDCAEAETDWTDEGGGVYSIMSAVDSSRRPGNASENGKLLRYTGNRIPASGEYTIDISGKVQIAGDPSGKKVRVSQRNYGIHGTGVSYITIENIQIRQASLHGIQFEDSHDIQVRNCTIEMCGGAYISGSIQAGNGIEFGNSSNNCVIENCIVREIFDSGVTVQTYESNQSIAEIIFRNSTIEKCGFAGVEIAVLSNGGTTGSSVCNVLIDNVKIKNSGEGFSSVRYGNEGRGIKIAADSGAGFITGISVEDSQIEFSANEGIYINGETGAVVISRSEFTGNRNDGVKVADAASTSTSLKVVSSLIKDNAPRGIVYNAVAGTGIEVYNCSFLNNTTIGLAVFSNSGFLKVKNNIFYSPATHLFSLYPVTVSEIDYNCYYQNSSAIIGWGGTSYNSVSDFHSSSALFDTNSTGVDPGLSPDFIPVSTACRSKGVFITGVTLDNNGTAFRNPPTIGAFEY